MSNSPRVRQLPPRPKITLPVPGQHSQYPQTPLGYVTTPYGQTPIPLTPVSGQPHMMYANKASGFMFAQLKGLKNFTKSGLSVGEKCAFWLYEKVSSWSKKWFTHIFLFFIVLLYSIAGAMIFIAVEGNHETELRLDIIKYRNEALNEIKELLNDSMVLKNPELFKGRATNALTNYEIELYKKFKHGITDPSDKTWTFWNAVFYCGTIYTTIELTRIKSLCGPCPCIAYCLYLARDSTESGQFSQVVRPNIDHCFEKVSIVEWLVSKINFKPQQRLYHVLGTAVFEILKRANTDILINNARRDSRLQEAKSMCKRYVKTNKKYLGVWKVQAWNVFVSMELEERGDAKFCRAPVCGIVLWSVVKQHGRSTSWRPVRYPRRAAAKHPVVLARVVGAASVLFLSGVQPGRREILGISVDMEDSYTVHRRRKAAARRREKTPDPPRRLEDVSDDEDARARMEKMVEDTEKMEELVETVNKDSDKIVLEEDKAKMKELEDKGAVKKEEGEEASMAKKSSQLVDNASKNSAETRDSDVRVEKENGARSVNPESYGKDTNKEEAKVSRVTDSRKQEGEESVKSVDNVTVSGPAVKMEGRSQNGEKRVKRRSKDRSERHSYTTDSSDGEERSKINLRRKKSPEGPKSKVSVGKKPSSRSRFVTDTDDDLNASRTESSINEKSTRSVKRVSSKHRYSTGTDDDSSPRKNESLNEKGSTEEFQSRRREERGKTRERSAARHRYPSDTDEDIKIMKKSETFPQQSVDKTIIRRSASEMKKQIIPLSDDSLIEDFAKAQEEYLRRERGILDPDPSDAFYKTNKDSSARRRKASIIHTEPEKEKIVKDVESKRSWLSWLSFFGKKEKIDEPVPDTKPKIIEKTKEEISNDAKKKSKKINERERVSIMEYFRALRDIVSEFKAFVEQNPKETQKLRNLRNRCVADLILVIIYCGLGGFVFRFTEGAFETFYKCGVKRVKRDFLDSLWNYSHNMREDDWKSMARRKLMEFEEQLHTAHEAGVHSYSGQKSWTFLNAVVYCLTVITTIGYGHISPNTTTGKALTIIYAIFGIPMFLIILADFGKLFTRIIKFLWAFVRRLYYTGSCRKVRRTAPMQEVMKGVQLVYDFATFRRPSQMNPEELEEMQKQQNQTETVINLDGNMPQPETPGTPAMSAYTIDDEFNLPISVAIFVLLGYIFIGATGFYWSEDWSFFESFYFVFISMSTIGFGDYVPQHPMYMMISILYLLFGLALTSMCINVVQVILSDSFKQASQKIGATIGFEVVEDDGSVQPAVPDPVELADVHVTVKESNSQEIVAPKAQQENVEL